VRCGTLAGQQVADLDHRQPLVDPLVDLIVVGAQHFPRRPKSLGAVRANHGLHRADQLVVELINTTGPVQAGSHRSLDTAAGGFSVHPGLGGRHAQSVACQPRPKYFTNLDHRNLPKDRRTPSHDFDVKRSDPVIERPRRDTPMVPLLAIRWSHDRGADSSQRRNTEVSEVAVGAVHKTRRGVMWVEKQE
jgi:hypothetical protein